MCYLENGFKIDINENEYVVKKDVQIWLVFPKFLKIIYKLALIYRSTLNSNTNIEIIYRFSSFFQSKTLGSAFLALFTLS